VTLFVTVCAALVLVALLFALPPFLRRPKELPRAERRRANLDIYREQIRDLERDLTAGTLSREQYEKDREELSRRMLEDVQADTEVPTVDGGNMARVAPALAIAALFPIVAVLIYAQIGAPGALNPDALKTAAPHAGQQFTQEQVEQMVTLLAQRMEKEPDNLEGWVLLGRSYAAMGRYPEAATALRHAAQLKANDPNLLADYADALAMASGQKLDGEPLKLIDQALAIEPHHQKSLALAGTGAFERGDYADAVKYWERLLKTVPPESDGARSIQTSIDEARTRAGGNAPKAAQAPEAPTAAQAKQRAPREASATGSAGRIAGVVSLAPSLAAKAAPDDTLFVYARAVQGPPIPLAVQRFRAKDLPASFSLDDSMAMAPEMTLSKLPNVMVLARISKSGNAMPQSGDLQGSTGPVKLGGAGVKIVIDRVVP